MKENAFAVICETSLPAPITNVSLCPTMDIVAFHHDETNSIAMHRISMQKVWTWSPEHKTDIIQSMTWKSNG